MLILSNDFFLASPSLAQVRGYWHFSIWSCKRTKASPCEPFMHWVVKVVLVISRCTGCGTVTGCPRKPVTLCDVSHFKSPHLSCRWIKWELVCSTMKFCLILHRPKLLKSFSCFRTSPRSVQLSPTRYLIRYMTKKPWKSHLHFPHPCLTEE